MIDVDRWLWEFGEAGVRLSQLGASEGAAGNISLFLPEQTPRLATLLKQRFPAAEAYALPDPWRLPPGALLVTGSGTRLRDAAAHLDAVLCIIVVRGDGTTRLHRSPAHEVRPTSEIDSHAAVHATMLVGAPSVHAVVHAQPPKLTWLSHIRIYQTLGRLNRQLLRWQPETLVAIPEGIGVLPFETPGTPAQGAATAAAMQHFRLVVWARHGVIARSPLGPLAAADLVDYAEAAASYEVTDLLAGRQADGLSLAELRAIAERYGVATSLLNDLPRDILPARSPIDRAMRDRRLDESR
jgi:rhamnulose-1-phosphate aldolase